MSETASRPLRARGMRGLLPKRAPMSLLGPGIKQQLTLTHHCIGKPPPRSKPNKTLQGWRGAAGEAGNGSETAVRLQGEEPKESTKFTTWKDFLFVWPHSSAEGGTGGVSMPGNSSGSPCKDGTTSGTPLEPSASPAKRLPISARQ